MSRPSEPGCGSLTVGASRLTTDCLGGFWASVLPDEGDLIKREEKTLVWRKTIEPNERVIIKMYRQRSFLDWHRERAFRHRVQREYDTLLALESAGVPCSPPLLWGAGTSAEHGRFEILVTREISGSVGLREQLATGDRTLRPDDLLPLFEMIRRMHQCGVYHGALSPKNILLAGSPGRGHRFHIIDMARAVCFPADISNTDMALFDLLSLMRRLCQLRGDAGCEGFLRAYGLAEKGIGGFMARLKRFRPTHHTRNWLALRFRVRATVARF